MRSVLDGRKITRVGSKKCLDLGDRWWTLDNPKASGLSFESKKAARIWADRNGQYIQNLTEHDNRMARGELAEIIEEAEGDVWGEYISSESPDPMDNARDMPVPTGWELRTLKVYAVTGGSEGVYLHVEAGVIDHAIGEVRPDLLVLGKSLHCSYEECAHSAARIATFLPA